MKRFKKAFTLVELLVVIAILAVLSGVGIIGYTSFTKKANRQHDETVVNQLNEHLRGDKVALGNNLTVDQAVNAFLEDNELDVLSTKSKELTIGFNDTVKEFRLYDIDDKVTSYTTSGDHINDAIGDNDILLFYETAHFADLTYYVATDIALNKKVTIKATPSIKCIGDYRVSGNVEFASSIAGTINLEGTFIGNVTVNNANAVLNQKGIITGDGYGTYLTVFDKGQLNVLKANTITVNGYVDQLSIANSKLTISTDGVIRQVNSFGKNVDTFINNGYVNYVAGTVPTNTNNGYLNGTKAASYTFPTSLNLETTEDLLKFAAKTLRKGLPYIVGTTGYAPITVNLNADISVKNFTYIPMSSYANSNGGGGDASGLGIILNGNNHKITGLRNNFIGGLGKGSKVENLTLIVDYESRDGGTKEENIFYRNNKSTGLVTPYYLHPDGNYYMHVGILANSIVSDNANMVEITNLSVGGKMIFKNCHNAVWFAMTVCAGEFSGDTTAPIFHVHDLTLLDGFEYKVINVKGVEKYTDTTTSIERPCLYTGDMGSGNNRVLVTYSNAVETGSCGKASSVYPNFGTMMVGGKLVNSAN